MAKRKGIKQKTPKKTDAGPVVLSEEDLTEVQGGAERKRPPLNLVTWGKGFPTFNKSGSFSSDDTA